MLTSNYSSIKIVDISIRIKIDPIFDVHIRVEKKKSTIWDHFFGRLFLGSNIDNNIQYTALFFTHPN